MYTYTKLLVQSRDFPPQRAGCCPDHNVDEREDGSKLENLRQLEVPRAEIDSSLAGRKVRDAPKQVGDVAQQKSCSNREAQYRCILQPLYLFCAII